MAATFLTWLPTFIYRKFAMGVSGSSTTSTVWPLASLVGALCGGVLADWAARYAEGRTDPGAEPGPDPRGPVRLPGRMVRVGRDAGRGSLAAAGLCKGIYDANIFASLFDVVRPEDRGTAAGLMNSVGWTGGFLAPPFAVGMASEHFGLSVAIASTAAVYLLVGILALVAARLAEARQSVAPPRDSVRRSDTERASFVSIASGRESPRRPSLRLGRTAAISTPSSG